MDLKEEIISLIRRNRISTTEVADALGKSGLIPKVLPLLSNIHRAGEATFIYAFNHSNWETHEQIAKIGENKVVYVHGIECGDRAIFGHLVSKYLILYKQAVAVVVNGFVRDVHALVRENYPIWCTGRSPIGCFNVKNDVSPPEDLLEELQKKFEGGILVCDDSGVVLIEPHQITEDLKDRLAFIELQEDVWYFCMDSMKMSTYDIVCEKKYIKDEGLIHPTQLSKLSEFSSRINRRKK